MVPKFSHAFFLSTNLWLLAKHLLNFCQIHHFWQKFAFFRKSVIVKEAFIVLSFEFCSNFSCILPKFTIFAKIFYPRKNLFTNRPFFAIFFVIWIFGKPFITSYQMFTRIVIFVKIANSQHASFVISFDFCQTLWIAAKFAISVIIPICQDAPFCHLFCQLFRNFCQTLDNFLPNLSLFVISFEYLTKPLMNFWHTRHFCWNLPLSSKFPIFLRCPFFYSHLNFAKPLMDFSKNSMVSQKMAFS